MAGCRRRTPAATTAQTSGSAAAWRSPCLVHSTARFGQASMARSGRNQADAPMAHLQEQAGASEHAWRLPDQANGHGVVLRVGRSRPPACRGDSGCVVTASGCVPPLGSCHWSGEGMRHAHPRACVLTDSAGRCWAGGGGKSAGRCALVASRAVRCRATPLQGNRARKRKSPPSGGLCSELPAPPPPSWMGDPDAYALSR